MSTFDQQVAGGADGSSLTGSSASEAATIFSKRLADHQTGETVFISDLKINGVLDSVILSEPHNGWCGVTWNLALQSHTLSLSDGHILQTLDKINQIITSNFSSKYFNKNVHLK